MTDKEDVVVAAKEQSKPVNPKQKPLYLILATDPSIKQGFRHYLSTRKDVAQSIVEMEGWELSTKQVNEIKTGNDAAEIVKTLEPSKVVLTIPLTHVISIKTLR